MQLSHSRFDAVVWSERKDQLAWLHCHGEALKRIGGVPATVRIDNEKTAIATGAGAWGEIHIAYRRYAEVARFHVDACAPRSPEHKGKVERRIRDQRLAADPRSSTRPSAAPERASSARPRAPYTKLDPARDQDGASCTSRAGSSSSTARQKRAAARRSLRPPGRLLGSSILFEGEEKNGGLCPPDPRPDEDAKP